MKGPRLAQFASWLLALCCAWLLVACGSDGMTQIEVTIDSDLEVPAELDRVRIEVLGVRTRSAEADLAEEGLPRTIGLYHSEGPLGPFSVRVGGFKGTTLVIEKTVETSFVRGKTIPLHVRLDRACKDLRCPSGQTCEQGVCRNAASEDDAGMVAFDGGQGEGGPMEPDGSLPSACPVGYVGTDAANCQDLDECATGADTCDALTQCVNRAGSYGCTVCPFGYGGNPKLRCESINECAAGLDQCDPFHPCTDTATGYLCGDCAMGYTGDGKDTCRDIDECALGACDARTVCTNTPGGFNCSACPAGYAGTGKTSCEDIDECAQDSDDCDPLTQCVNSSGGYQCTACPPGYSGDGLSGCLNIDECAGTTNPCVAVPCVDRAGSYQCGDCPVGFQDTGLGACEDIDECASAGACDPLTVCVNAAGSFTCTACPTGYTGNGKISCTDLDECADATDRCDELTACVNLPGDYGCTACPLGYAGTGLTGCTNLDECALGTDLCDALSECRDIPGGYRCGGCPGGYTGDGLGGCTDIDECAISSACDPLTTCANSAGGFTCTACPPGYVGSGQTSCADVDECASGTQSCDRLTQCVNQPGDYGCTTCPAGYSGDGRSGCTNIDECASGAAKCPALTLCVDNAGSFLCLPSIRIADGSVQEGSAGSGTLSFSVTLSAAVTQTVTVSYATADGTALAGGSAATGGADYVAKSGVITFAAGETTKTVQVAIQGDVLNEPDETFLVNLSNAIHANFADNQGQGTIRNDDAAPALSIADGTTTEGNGGTKTLSFDVTLSAPSGQSVSVAYATADGTASASGAAASGGSDYVSQSGKLTFAAGETRKTLSVTINGDLLNEVNETLLINLSSPTLAVLADAQAQGTIENDDALPSMAIADASVAEGQSGTRQLSFTVSLSGASGRSVSASYTTVDASASAAGSAATGGSDYVAQSGTLTFAAGETQKTLSVTINGDTLNELNETFLVNLSGPVNATLADAQGAGTIENDDAQPTLSIADATRKEGDVGSSTLTFTVSLSAASGRQITVNFATSNGTAVTAGSVATGGSDYEAQSGTLTFAAGETSKTIGVTIHGDVLIEADQTFVVTLSAATNAMLADGQAIGTIANDDITPSWSIEDASTSEGQSGQKTISFNVTLTLPAGESVSVQYATSNGSAVSSGVNGTGGADYVAKSGTLTFAPGETRQTLSVTINSDLLNEDDETFFVNLSSPSASSNIADGQAQGVIVNDDAMPTIAMGDVSAFEGDGGLTEYIFTATLSAPTARTVTVVGTTADFTAAGTDYVSRTETLTFAPGATTQPFIVKVRGDRTIEGDETFFVNLSSPSNAEIADAQGVGTIKNDD